MSKGYALIVALSHALNKLIKLNGINYFGEKNLIKKANSQKIPMRQKTTSLVFHHFQYFTISPISDHSTYKYPERERESRKKKVFPGSRFYAEVSISSSNSLTKGLNKHVEPSRATIKFFTRATSSDLVYYVIPTIREGCYK